MKPLPFTSPTLFGNELDNLAQVLGARHLQGDGAFTEKCHEWLERHYNALAFLTHSCTAALEMAAMLTDCGAGDEVIMPSYTFVSTANAFVLRGATPVFVDVRADTFNLDETLIEQAITPKTRAIAPVHYAGVACDMDAICALAARHNLAVVEDAAQALGSTYKGRSVGTHGSLAAVSFHQTKNIMSGEGGALIVNDRDLRLRAYIIREKGTNRTQFMNREVQKYEWLDIGSSYLPSDLIGAVLLPQLDHMQELTQRRLKLWTLYHQGLQDAESKGLLRRPVIPADCGHNAHIYHVLLPAGVDRSRLLAALKAEGIGATSHYVPLHSSPAGQRFGRTAGTMAVTDRVAESSLRLPLFADMQEGDVARVIEALLRQI